MAIEQGSGDDESPFWTRWRRIGAFIVGAAAVITAVITVLTPEREVMAAANRDMPS